MKDKYIRLFCSEMSEQNKDLAKKFVHELDFLSQKYGVRNIFQDFLQITVCMYHKINIQYACKAVDIENEKLYFSVLKKYSKHEINNFVNASRIFHEFEILNPYYDFLGNFYESFVSNGENGQFFTPEPIVELITKIISDSSFEKETILEPACGSGRMILISAKQNPFRIFTAIDLDYNCCLMTIINTFLHGLKGFVYHQDFLCQTIYNAWSVNMNGVGIEKISVESLDLCQKTKLVVQQQQQQKDLKQTKTYKNTTLNLFS